MPRRAPAGHAGGAADRRSFSRALGGWQAHPRRSVLHYPQPDAEQRAGLAQQGAVRRRGGVHSQGQQLSGGRNGTRSKGGGNEGGGVVAALGQRQYHHRGTEDTEKSGRMKWSWPGRRIDLPDVDTAGAEADSILDSPFSVPSA